MQFDAHILALRLKKLRNKRNITQEHLAEMVNIPPNECAKTGQIEH